MAAYWDEEQQKWIDKNEWKNVKGDTPLGCVFVFFFFSLIFGGITTGKVIYWILAGTAIIVAAIVGNNQKLSSKLNNIVGIILIIGLIVGFAMVYLFFRQE